MGGSVSVFVLISGGWSGGWAWRPVALSLRQAGHDVHTPTLTGLAERAHVRTAEPTTFSTHVQDVRQLLYFEDLNDVVLVGWSYGGAVIDGVADLVPERVAHVVNLDGEVVQEGKLLSDGWTEQEREQFQDGLEEASRTGWITAPTELDPGRDPDTTRWVLQRLRDQPLGTYTEPYPDNGARRYAIRHTYLRCGSRDGEEPIVTALRTDSRWIFREIQHVDHLAIYYVPQVVADALLQAAH
jgi:pimeloyl-ACP methyl ester carboxylesterase